ncbi:MAG: DUF1003 domain-containing protein [Rhodobacteraceae bacterium]|nr:DUF1003 domain-containing protein [Paracoccaceae bacterium]
MTAHRAERKAPCHVCTKVFPLGEVHPWEAVRPGVAALIDHDHPGWEPGKHICRADLNRYRGAYVEALLEKGRGELGALDRQVIESLQSGRPVSQNPHEDWTDQATFGERMADSVASFGGSWTFILLFSAGLIVWMTVNVIGLMAQPFDPYPFILLNLMLSSLAALQAPIIMMSQRRQETKDRARAENDYLVNLKAELEIRQLHEKIDHQMAEQWNKLAELQQIQIDLLEDRMNDRR